jgi:Protein of unknown function (DUF3500)
VDEQHTEKKEKRMKLLCYGPKGPVCPALLDKEGKLRDLSGVRQRKRNESKLWMRTFRGVGAWALICSSMTVAAAQTATSRIVSAANSFLSTLEQKQRQSVLFAFDDEKQRVRWSNLPVSRGAVSV